MGAAALRWCEALRIDGRQTVVGVLARLATKGEAAIGDCGTLLAAHLTPLPVTRFIPILEHRANKVGVPELPPPGRAAGELKHWPSKISPRLKQSQLIQGQVRQGQVRQGRRKRVSPSKAWTSNLEAERRRQATANVPREGGRDSPPAARGEQRP